MNYLFAHPYSIINTIQGGISMARINVDDKLFLDPRYQKLVAKLGCPKLALGNLLTAWFLAQRYWVPNKQEIPISVWNESDISEELFKLGLAKLSTASVYVRGTEERCEWLFSVRERGSKGGSTRAARRLKSLGKISSSAKQTQASLLSSLSSSLSSLNSDLNTSDDLSGSPAKDDNHFYPVTNKVWEAYSDAYLKRYGIYPKRNAMVNGQLKNFVGRLGEKDAIHVAKFYLTHNESFYQKKAHSVGAMLHDSEKLLTEWKTGNKIDSLQVKSKENVSNYHAQLDRITKGIQNES